MEKWIYNIEKEMRKTIFSVQSMQSDIQSMKDAMAEQGNKLYWVWVRMENRYLIFTEMERESIDRLRQDLEFLEKRRDKLYELTKEIEADAKIVIKKIEEFDGKGVEINTITDGINSLNKKMSLLVKQFEECNPLYMEYAENVKLVNQILNDKIKENSNKKKKWNLFSKKRRPKYE